MLGYVDSASKDMPKTKATEFYLIVTENLFDGDGHVLT